MVPFPPFAVVIDTLWHISRFLFQFFNCYIYMAQKRNIETIHGTTLFLRYICYMLRWYAVRYVSQKKYLIPQTSLLVVTNIKNL